MGMVICLIYCDHKEASKFQTCTICQKMENFLNILKNNLQSSFKDIIEELMCYKYVERGTADFK